MGGEPRFTADTMLGRLAKWLRVLGYDTLYLAQPGEGAPGGPAGEGRTFLSRRRKALEAYPDVFIIQSNHVGEQLLEMKAGGRLRLDPGRLFKRCLVCNCLLLKVEPSRFRESVPDYVFYTYREDMRFCPSCRRYIWPGSHRERMLSRLREWGLDPGGP